MTNSIVLVVELKVSDCMSFLCCVHFIVHSPSFLFHYNPSVNEEEDKEEDKEEENEEDNEVEVPPPVLAIEDDPDRALRRDLAADNLSLGPERDIAPLPKVPVYNPPPQQEERDEDDWEDDSEDDMWSIDGDDERGWRNRNVYLPFKMVKYIDPGFHEEVLAVKMELFSSYKSGDLESCVIAKNGRSIIIRMHIPRTITDTSMITRLQPQITAAHPWATAHALAVRLETHEGEGKIMVKNKVPLPYKVEQDFFTADGGKGRDVFSIGGKVILMFRCMIKREDFLVDKFKALDIHVVPDGSDDKETPKKETRSGGGWLSPSSYFRSKT